MRRLALLPTLVLLVSGCTDPATVDDTPAGPPAQNVSWQTAFGCGTGPAGEPCVVPWAGSPGMNPVAIAAHPADPLTVAALARLESPVRSIPDLVRNSRLVLSVTTDGGLSWTARDVEATFADRPLATVHPSQLLWTPDGVLHAVGEVQDVLAPAHVADEGVLESLPWHGTTRDLGETWDSVLVGRGWDARLAVGPEGLLLTWTDLGTLNLSAARSFDGGASWEEPILLDAQCGDPLGSAHAAGRWFLLCRVDFWDSRLVAVDANISSAKEVLVLDEQCEPAAPVASTDGVLGILSGCRAAHLWLTRDGTNWTYAERPHGGTGVPAGAAYGYPRSLGVTAQGVFVGLAEHMFTNAVVCQCASQVYAYAWTANGTLVGGAPVGWTDALAAPDGTRSMVEPVIAVAGAADRAWFLAPDAAPSFGWATAQPLAVPG